MPKKISSIGLVTFAVFGSCIGHLALILAVASGIGAEPSYIMAFTATFIAAWTGSRTCLDETCAVAVTKLFWITYFPVVIVCWYGITDGTVESFIRFGTVGALATGIFLGADGNAGKDAEADHRTMFLSFVAIACQFALVQWPLGNDVTHLMIVSLLTLCVSLLGAFHYGRPTRTSRETPLFA